jgi:hypothetical protein
MRTTLDLEAPVLRDLKRLSEREGKSLGRVASELLAVALASRGDRTAAAPVFAWRTADMGQPRVDLADRDAVLDAMDAHDRGTT